MDGIVDCLDIPPFSADGFCDAVDNIGGVAPGVAVPDPDTDGDGVVDRLDVDSDNDGVTDANEAGGAGSDLDGDGRIDCVGAFVPDGFCADVDLNDGGAPVADPDTDSDGIVDRLDLDSDNDGVADLVEAGGDDTDGDGIVDEMLDSDGDSIPDACDVDITTGPDAIGPDGIDDNCQVGPDADGDGISDVSDSDADGDGYADSLDSDDDNMPGAGDGGTALPDTDADGDGDPDRIELDSDGDGIPDIIEAGGVDADDDGKIDALNPGGTLVNDADGDGFDDAVDGDDNTTATVADGGTALPDPDTDGDGVADRDDLDSDNDGVPDSVEAGMDPNNPVDTDSDGIPDYLDLDSDNDGIPDVKESGGVDADGDGVIDCTVGFGADGFCPDVDPIDGGTALPDPDTDGDGVEDRLDLDSDNDGVSDAGESGGDDADGDGIIDSMGDADDDGIPDTCDVDITLGADAIGPDGIDDSCQVGPDTDGDGISDTSDSDADGDGFDDSADSDDNNMPGAGDGGTPLPDPDSDGDGVVDHLDLDSDNDGIPDVEETGGVDTDGDGVIDCTVGFGPDGYCPDVDPADGGTPLPDPDTDMDGINDALDKDSDNDGISDAKESGSPDADGDGEIDCSAGFGADGFCPDVDTGDGGTSAPQPDTDMDGIPNHEDLDSDNDGIPDILESGGTDMDGDGKVDGSADDDSDGIPNTCDVDVTLGADVIGPDGIDDSCQGGTDSDGDGIQDSSDPDADGDGFTDTVDSDDNNTPGTGDGGTPAPDTDSDMDGTPDREELDSDGDNIPDSVEAGSPDADEDGLVDDLTDTDGDGLADSVDPDNGGTPVDPPDSDGDGIPDFQEPGALQSPVFGVWNGFYGQENVVSMRNSSDETTNVTLTLFDINGTLLHTQFLVVDPNVSIDVSVNALPGFSPTSYGFLRLVFDPSTGFDAQMNLYRMTGDGSDVEFAIVKPFENIRTGTTYALFNTLQPSSDPAQAGNWLPQWTQIINLDTVNGRGFTYNLYDQAGTLVFSENIGIPPFGRRDRQAGHELPNGTVGLVEVIPDDPTTEYIAQLFYYSQNAAPDEFPDSFSFALGGESRETLTDDHVVTTSRGASGQSWVSVANSGTTAAFVVVDFFNSTGAAGSQSATIPAKSQLHFLADDTLGDGETGYAVIRPIAGAEVVTETRTYFRNIIGQVTAAYTIPGREISDRSVLGAPYNYFLNASNWIRLHNPEATAQDVTIEVYDQAGVLLGTVPETIPAGETAEFEINASLGLGVGANTIGLVRVVPNNPNTVFGDLLRTKVGSGTAGPIDFAKPIPFRQFLQGKGGNPFTLTLFKHLSILHYPKGFPLGSWLFS